MSLETLNELCINFVHLSSRSEKLYVTKSNRDEEKSSRCGKYFCIFLGMAVILGGIAVAILVGGEESRVHVGRRSPVSQSLRVQQIV